MCSENDEVSTAESFKETGSLKNTQLKADPVKNYHVNLKY